MAIKQLLLQKMVRGPSKYWKLFSLLYVFLTPPALPRVHVIWFPVQQTYSLSSPAFKRVTSEAPLKHSSPLPPVTQGT